MKKKPTMTFERRLDLILSSCSGLKGPDPADQAMSALQALGTDFLWVTRDRPHPDPRKAIDKDGNVIIPFALAHPALSPEWKTPKELQKGTANFGCVAEGTRIMIGQDSWKLGETEVNRMALCQVDFCMLLYPRFRPMFASVDEAGENYPDSRSISATQLKRIFWANFFGPAYVRKYGREFLLSAPGWKVQELDDGGILYLTCESFLDWWRIERKDILEYFRRVESQVRLFNSKELNIY